MLRNVEDEPQNRQYENQPKAVNIYRPVATYAIIAVNVLFFIFINVLSGGKLIHTMSISRREFSVYKLFTSMFTHGSIQHIFCNMMALYSLGAGLERFLGRKKYLLLYFLSGLGSALTIVVFSKYSAVGASGAIFGLMGFYLMLALMNRNILGETLRKNILPPLLINILVTLIIPNISVAGHFGGLFSGMIFYLIFFRNKKLVYRADPENN